METSEKHAIHGYVCPDIHVQFEAYRRELGLTSGSALLTLLLLREIKLRRLATCDQRPRDGHPRNAKISAYIDSNKALAFMRFTEELGRSASDCAADLIERELEERWLQAAIGAPALPESAA